MFKFLLLLFTLFMLPACLPDANGIPKTKEEIQIISGNLGREQFFIPYGYFKYGLADFEDGSISLEMIQPEFIPFIKSGQQMLDDGEHTKLIRILVNKDKGAVLNYSKHINDQISFFYAFETVNQEYGLTHLTQPKGYVQDWDDIWVERQGEDNLSYIACDDDNSVPFPQCAHSFKIGNVYALVDYDKRNLPNWKKIQNGILETFNSFKSSETARDSLFQKYTDYKINNKTANK